MPGPPLYHLGHEHINVHIFLQTPISPIPSPITTATSVHVHIQGRANDAIHNAGMNLIKVVNKRISSCYIHTSTKSHVSVAVIIHGSGYFARSNLLTRLRKIQSWFSAFLTEQANVTSVTSFHRRKQQAERHATPLRQLFSPSNSGYVLLGYTE